MPSVLLYNPVDRFIQQRKVLRYRLQAEPLEPGPFLQPVAPAQQVTQHHWARALGMAVDHAAAREAMPGPGKPSPPPLPPPPPLPHGSILTPDASCQDSNASLTAATRADVDGVGCDVILVAEYDAAWPVRFEQLRQEYARAMAAAGVPVVSIEHVGSTAVPGLAAKPVIACDIVVAGQDAAAASRVLAGLGFTPLGKLGIPLRWAFKEPERLAPTNTYVVVQDSLSLRNHLAVRDILRADPGLREQYAAVKRRAGAIAANIDEYGRGKNAMVQRILGAAGLTAAERASIDANQVPSHDEVPR